MPQKMLEDWDVWYPKAGATGIPFARGRCDPATIMLIHAAPPCLTVTVYSADGRVLAFGQDLDATDSTPITRLARQGSTITRQDIWPGSNDIGALVLLPGGEIGRLLSWWHAADHSEWRWQVEFYNYR
ncbi:MAG: DUF7712 family protein [Aggregatilineales bacterium]